MHHAIADALLAQTTGRQLGRQQCAQSQAEKDAYCFPPQPPPSPPPRVPPSFFPEVFKTRAVGPVRGANVMHVCMTWLQPLGFLNSTPH